MATPRSHRPTVLAPWRQRLLGLALIAVALAAPVAVGAVDPTWPRTATPHPRSAPETPLSSLPLLP